MALVAGVDSSTQSTKVEVRDLESGDLVARAQAAHPPTTPPVSEQDPRSWWDALVESFFQLGDHRNELVAISVAGQQHGLVLLDEAGDPVRPAKLWNDTTSAPQAEALVAAAGPEKWAAGCGSVPVASFTITKLAWVLEHEPGIAERVARVMLPHDYLTWRLSGAHVTDRGDASGTGWFDPSAGRYDEWLLGQAAPAATWVERLPEVLGPTEAAGEIDAAAAAALGVPTSVVIGPGTGDNMGAALGLGLAPGDIAMSLGTSGTVYGVSRTGTADTSGAVAGFADAAGRFLPLVCTLNATKVTDTVARWLGTDAPGLAQLALEANPRDDGPVLVPYFDGERTPNLPDATGTFTGLRNDTTREELALAAHDGVVCGLLDGLDALADAGLARTGRLLLIGGGARSAAYRQRVATLAETTIVVPDADETVATGAAAQAAAVQSDRSLDEIATSWSLGAGEVTEPDGDAGSIRLRYAAASRLHHP